MAVAGQMYAKHHQAAEQNICQQKTLAQPSREAEGRNNWQHKKLSAAE
jgi:hypothetical protein